MCRVFPMTKTRFTLSMNSNTCTYLREFKFHSFPALLHTKCSKILMFLWVNPRVDYQRIIQESLLLYYNKRMTQWNQIRIYNVNHYDTRDFTSSNIVPLVPWLLIVFNIFIYIFFQKYIFKTQNKINWNTLTTGFINKLSICTNIRTPNRFALLYCPITM